MDFAKNQLEKHGWKAGQGLGKDEHGIKEAIKVKIKKDVTGVGHDPGEEFTFHWWDHVFNKAANNLNVENSEGGVQVKNVSDVNVSRKKPLGKVLDNKAMLYGRFVKAATLDNGLETPQASDSSSESDDDDDGVHTSLNHLTDEELLKICGGRTAHKGARHGIKMNGKLARIEHQEMMILAAQSDSSRSSPVPNVNDSIVKKKRKAEEPGEQDSIEVIHKEKRKKKKKTEISDFDNEHKKEIDNDKKEKKKNRKHIEENAEETFTENIENKTAKRKKKKKSEECGSPDDTIEENVNNNDAEDKDSISAKMKKKKSKSKRRDVVSSSDVGAKTDSDDNSVRVKKSKKHKKKKQNQDR